MYTDCVRRRTMIDLDVHRTLMMMPYDQSGLISLLLISLSTGSMDGGGLSQCIIASCPKERSIKVLDLHTQTVYASFADSSTPSRGLASIGGAGSAEVRRGYGLSTCIRA